jgi:putative NADH-flavin reductase
MILVTGATGTIGSHVVRLLAERGVPFRAMSRRERPGGVRADFDDPASLARAVADVDTVFLVTVPPVPTADHDIALVTAARAAGVRKVVEVPIALGAAGVLAGQQFQVEVTVRSRVPQRSTREADRRERLGAREPGPRGSTPPEECPPQRLRVETRHRSCARVGSQSGL